MRRYPPFLIYLLILSLFCSQAAFSQWIPDGSGGVNKIIAGTNITITPTNGLGNVTINAAGAGAGGAAGQIQYNNGGVLGGFTANGDATINTATGAVAVTKTGGVAFAPSATTDTTNASNISSGSLSLGRIAAIANNTVLGNVSGSSAVPSALTQLQATALMNVFTSGLQGMAPASGGGTTNYLRADGTWAAPPGATSGTVTSFSAGTLSPLFTTSVATATTTPALTFALTNAASNTLFGRAVASTGAPSYFTPTGDVQLSAGALTIQNSAVTLAKQANLAANSIIGNNTGSAAVPLALTQAQVTAMINTFTSVLAGDVPASGGGTTNFLRADGSWAAPPGGGTIGGSIASTQVAVGSGANTIAGSADFTISGASVNLGTQGTTAGTITLRGTGATTNGAISIAGSSAGNANINFFSSSGQSVSLGANTTGSSITYLLPGSLPAVSGAAITANTSGSMSPNIFKNTPGFGGDGSDGAITTWTTPLLNATTVTCSSSTGPTSYGIIAINATQTAAFNNSTFINAIGLGHPGAQPAGTALPINFGTGGRSGGGGMGTSSALPGGGGGGGVGAGGAGGGVTTTGGYPGAAASSTVIDMGAGGGNSTFAAGGNGGALVRVCAVGALSTAAGASISASGAVGGAGTTARGAGGGGAGGAVALFSQTSNTIAAGTITVAGGAGGAGLTTGCGGGGGGGGLVFMMSPSNSNSLVTATACAGGAGGGTGSGTVGAAGTLGSVIAVTGTPNTPLLCLFDRRGYGPIVEHCKQTEIAYNDGYDLNQTQVSRWMATNITEYIACMETADVPVGHKPVNNVIEMADRARRRYVA